MTQFHALLVGINAYQNPRIPPLNGCVPDVERMSQFLQASLKDRLSLKTLTDQEATKEQIVRTFQDHFGKAGAGDTVLFYFSGHGALETPHPALQAFNQNRQGIETLCCYDSLTNEGTLLADKELRYLIYQLAAKTKARIVLLTDSCHSGGVTRNIVEGAQRRLAWLAPKRAWEQFIFHQDIPQTDLARTTDLEEVLPQGLHIHLAACESREPAWEINGRGAFTSGLLNVLSQSAGTVNFHDLHSRVRYLVRQRFDQSPELYIVDPQVHSSGDGAAQSLRYTSFLEGAASGGQTLAGAHWDAQKRLWLLDKGAVHGMPPRSKAAALTIKLLDTQTGAPVSEARITQVQPSDCIIEPVQTELQARGQYFQAEVGGLYLEPLNVWLNGNETGVSLVRSMYEKNPSLFQDRNIRLMEDRAQADYLLLSGAKGYVIANNWDSSDPDLARPVCKQSSGHKEASVRQVAGYLGAIAHWHFVKRIQNPESRPDWDLAQAVRFELEYQLGFATKVSGKFEYQWLGQPQTFDCGQYENADPQEMLPHKVLRIDMPQPALPGQIPIVNLKARITRAGAQSGNASYWDKAARLFGISKRSSDPFAGKPLYTGLLYLSQLYGVAPKIESDVVPLERPGEYAMGFGPNGANFKVDDFILKFNWPEETFFLKLFVSTTPFQLASLSQNHLPAPEWDAFRSTAVTKGQLEESQTQSPDLPDWLTRMVEVRLAPNKEN